MYLTGDFGLTDKEKKKVDSGKIKDPLIFELRKRIDSYYKLVVRNLRDLVPKQVFNFLITKCLKQLEFEAFQYTSDINKLKELLNEVTVGLWVAIRNQEPEKGMHEGYQSVRGVREEDKDGSRNLQASARLKERVQIRTFLCHFSIRNSAWSPPSSKSKKTKKSVRKCIEKKQRRRKRAEGDSNKSKHSKPRYSKKPRKNSSKPKELIR